MIRAVVFDIGKVLIQFEWESFMRRLFDAETAEIVADATWHSPVWNELDRGVLPVEEVLRLFTQNAPAYAHQIRTAFARIGECPRMQPYAVPWIDELKARGLQVYYLSNYFGYLIEQCPHVLAFIPHTDGGVFSFQEQVTKPDPEIYQRLFRKYRLNPAECVFIDDLQANTDAAAQLGMHAFLFEGYEKSYPAIMAYLAEHTK